MTAGRGTLLLVVLAVGWLGANLLNADDVHLSSGYHFLVLALLAVGLYGSTREIELQELRGNFRTVLLAISVGVLAKVALISGVMYLFYREPASLVLGVAVAQIDPLAVAAAQGRKRMSASTRAVLNSWAAFDDPVTVLLTIYLSMFALQAQGVGTPATAGSPTVTFLLNLLLNLAFAAVAFAGWLAARRTGLAGWLASATVAARIGQVAVAVVVLGYAALGVAGSLMLGIAMVGLFFRPYARWKRTAENVLLYALLVATGALGVVLAGTADMVTAVTVLKGVLLGCAAYGAQMVAGRLLSRKRDRLDRLYLTLSQQNGLTAIVLALALEPDFPGAVAVIAPAIVVTNVLYALGSRYVGTVETRVVDEEERVARLKAKIPATPCLDGIIESRVRSARAAAPSRRAPGTAS